MNFAAYPLFGQRADTCQVKSQQVNAILYLVEEIMAVLLQKMSYPIFR